MRACQASAQSSRDCACACRRGASAHLPPRGHGGGAQSESYRTLHYLVERLPVMIAPAWLSIATQPIGINDVVEYLRRAPDVLESRGREVQIGGPDVLSFGGDARPHGHRHGHPPSAQAARALY